MTWPEPRNTFRKTNVKGRDRGHPSLPSRELLFQASLNSHVPGGRAGRRTAAPGNHSGKIQSRCHWANRRIFPSLETILETPMKETCFSCQLLGLKRNFCPPGLGTPERSAFLRMAGPPTPAPVCSSTSMSRAQRPWPRWAPAPTWRTDAAVTAISYDCH